MPKNLKQNLKLERCDLTLPTNPFFKYLIIPNIELIIRCDFITTKYDYIHLLVENYHSINLAIKILFRISPTCSSEKLQRPFQYTSSSSFKRSISDLFIKQQEGCLPLRSLRTLLAPALMSSLLKDSILSTPIAQCNGVRSICENRKK